MKEKDIRPKQVFDEYLALSVEDIHTYFSDPTVFVKVACPACGDMGCQPSFEKYGFRYVVCARCGTLYANPRPPAALLQTYYAKGKAPKFWNERFFRSTANARREKIFVPRARRLRELMAEVPGARYDTVVDVGAGFGIFLDVMREEGTFRQIIGIEPNPHLAETCRRKGFAVIEKAVEEVAEAEVQADVVTCFEVLEHVFDPLDFLQACRRILRPGGLLVFTTLTISGFDLQVLWERARGIHPPHHLNFISVDGFRQLLRRSDLELIRLLTPGELDLDIVKNYAAEHPEYELLRFVREILSRPTEAQTDFQAFLQRHLLSSHLWGVARA
ncbi:MAG: class I SAM-dependent methyltransferase [Anaerolineae bacterium]